MSINDPITVEYSERRKMYYLLQGRETFYDENRIMREWTTHTEAEQWAKENLGILVMGSIESFIGFLPELTDEIKDEPYG